MSSHQPVELSTWSHTGDRAELDRQIDGDVRHRVGGGQWTRRCAECGGDRHGARMFVPATGRPFSVSVAHAGSRHVATTAWGAARVGVDLEHLSAAENLGDLPLWPGDTGSDPADRLARWVAHEARVKLMGRGLGSDPTAVPLLTEPTEELLEAHGLWWRSLQWGDLLCIVASDSSAAPRTSAIAAVDAGPSVIQPGRP